MTHDYKIIDNDPCFEINDVTRKITNEQSSEIAIIQFDHNSERFTFRINKEVEGHDMTECNKIEVHYKNTNGTTLAETLGVYEVTDLHVDPDDETKLFCTWLISQNATQRVGKLDFLLRFSCVADDGTIKYAWNTSIFTGITVSAGLYNSEEILEQYVDVLEQWKKEIEAVGEPYNNAGEIFNDYENNKAISVHSSALGQNTFAGQKGFRIIDFSTYIWQSHCPPFESVENFYIILDSTDGLEVGDEISIRTDYNYRNIYKIIEINSGTELYYINAKETLMAEHYILINRSHISTNLKSNEAVAEEPWLNTLYVEAKPEVGTVDIGIGAHARGLANKALKVGAEAGGYNNNSHGFFSFTSGYENEAGYASTAVGGKNRSSGEHAFSSGQNNSAEGNKSDAFGEQTIASGERASSHGMLTKATGTNSVSEGMKTEAVGVNSHAQNLKTTAVGANSTAIGNTTSAVGEDSFVCGTDNTVYSNSGFVTGKHALEDTKEEYAYIIGGGTWGNRKNIHTVDWEGNAIFSGTVTSSDGKLVSEITQVGRKYNDGTGEVFNDYGNNTAPGYAAHAHGFDVHALGNNSTAQGYKCKAIADTSFAAGNACETEAWGATAIGNTCKGNGVSSFVIGVNNESRGEGQFVHGRNAVIDTSEQYAEVVGGGAWGARKNIHTLDWSGNCWYLGSVQCSGILMKSPNGTTFKITVDDNGNLTTAKI